MLQMPIKQLIFCLLFLFVGKNSKEETMTWDASQKLTWADFKANANSESGAIALTASGITFGYSLKTSGNRIIDFSTSVEAQFYPSQSWYLKGKDNDYILKHEQLHFDITQLFARKVREKLSRLPVGRTVKEQMNAIYKRIKESLNKEQKRYDLETEHSINKEVQKHWEDFIAEELKALDQFKLQ